MAAVCIGLVGGLGSSFVTGLARVGMREGRRTGRKMDSSADGADLLGLFDAAAAFAAGLQTGIAPVEAGGGRCVMCAACVSVVRVSQSPASVLRTGVDALP